MTHASTPDFSVFVRVTDTDERRVELLEYDSAVRDYRFTCTSGERFGGRWKGVPVENLRIDDLLPPETTHVLIESTDGFKVCADVLTVLSGLLALEDEDGPLPDAPRFVAEGIDGPRTVKRVKRLAPLELTADEAPEEFENFPEMKID